MVDRQSLRIGIDPRIATGQLTGIGNYTLKLLQALVEEFPELDYRSYNRASWTPADASTFLDIGKRQGKHGDAQTNISIGTRIGRRIRSRVSQNAAAKAIYDQIITGTYRWQFKRTVRQQNLQFFHAFNFIPLADPGVPTIPVVYDLSFIRYPHTHPSDRLRRLASLASWLERAPFIHTISEFSKAEISSVYGVEPGRIFVAPPAAGGIFTRRGVALTNSDLALYDLSHGHFFLAVGTLEPRKNLKTLIEAFSRLTPEQRQGHPLVVVGGTGWGDIELPHASYSMQREGSLRFVGTVSDNHLRSFYEGTRALLFPSIYEGFGMPVVEAFSCGAPVVHGKNSSMSEITGHLANQVTAENSDDWLGAMRRLLDQAGLDPDSEREKRVERANHYSWTRSAEIVRKIYSELVGR